MTMFQKNFTTFCWYTEDNHKTEKNAAAEVQNLKKYHVQNWYKTILAHKVGYFPLGMLPLYRYIFTDTF